MDTDKVMQDLNRRFAALLPEFYPSKSKYSGGIYHKHRLI